MSNRTVVFLSAVDWQIVEQARATNDWSPIRADVCGILVKETDDYVALTLEWFEDGDVRYTVTIPKCNIVQGTRRDFVVEE